MADQISDFLSRLSIEITARQVDKLPLIAARLKPGTKVFIALIDPADRDGQIAAAAAVRAHGLEPVPHVPARFIRDRDDLADRLGRFASGAEVSHMLVLGGGASEPLGIYDAAIGLIETGLFEANGVRRIGLAGHPEGNPDISAPPRRGHAADRPQGQAGRRRRPRPHRSYRHAVPLRGGAGGALGEGAQGVRHRPSHPCRRAGTGDHQDARKIRRSCAASATRRASSASQALNVSKLLTVSAPDDFIAGLARLSAEAPELRIAAPHIYPFGGFDRLFDWLDARLAVPA